MLYPIGEFANLIGITTQTLRNWDRSNYLKPVYVSKGGRRYYSDEQLNVEGRLISIKHLS